MMRKRTQFGSVFWAHTAESRTQKRAKKVKSEYEFQVKRFESYYPYGFKLGQF